MKNAAQRYPMATEFLLLVSLFALLLWTGHLGAVMYGQVELERYWHDSRALTGRYFMFWLALFIPWFETLLFQALPGVIGQIYVRNLLLQWLLQWLLMVLPFGFAHYDPAAVWGSLFNGLTGGVILGGVYLRYMPHSHYRAILITWLLHALSNGAAAVGEIYLNSAQ